MSPKTHTQNSSLPTERSLNPLLASTRPSRNVPLPFFPIVYHQPTQILHSRSIKRTMSIERCRMFHISMPFHLLFPLLKSPARPSSLAPDKLPLILKESSHLRGFPEPPKQLPTPCACANLPPIIYSIIALVTLHCTFFSSIYKFLPDKTCVLLNFVSLAIGNVPQSKKHPNYLE